MAEVGRGLIEQGAELVAILCVIAHFFQRQLGKEIRVPIVDAIKETAGYLKQAGINQVGLLVTDGTIGSGLFQKAFLRHGIRCIAPDPERQRQVMYLIYENIKAGKAVELSLFERVSGQLFERGGPGWCFWHAQNCL